MRTLEEKISEELKEEGYINPSRPLKYEFTTYVYEIKNPFGEIIKVEKYDYETYRKIKYKVKNVIEEFNEEAYNSALEKYYELNKKYSKRYKELKEKYYDENSKLTDKILDCFNDICDIEDFDEESIKELENDIYELLKQNCKNKELK